MNHEMAHELIKLPRYTAYAKIIEERGGDQTVIAPKFRAQKPPSVPHGRNRDIRDRALELTHSFYCKERTQIEEELRHRQKNWRKRSATEGTPANKHSPPASAEAERQQAKERNVPPTMKPEEPPPTYSRGEGRPTAPEEPPPMAEVRAPRVTSASKTQTPDDEIDKALQEKFKDLLDPKNWNDLWQ